ncbi:MAG TPA: sigma-70 family RNA polymerase sigma factor [Blastocatellia bacterium]|nr:sigma-70 family RNA polymerase sigma factor [Blastocatellia bacterium]
MITDLLPKVSKAVRRIYRHPTNQDEIEDLVQDVLLKLIEDNYRRLRSFANRSKIETWLHTVVRHHVGLYLWKRQWEKENVNLGDLSLDALIYQPVQEEVLIDEDEWKVLNAIISGLPERKRLLLRLVILGLKPEEIAEEMGIKIGSVYAEKSALFKEIRELLEVRQSCLAKQLEKIP